MKNTQSPSKRQTYFPGLNALRLYAAFAVIFAHLDENIKIPPFFTKTIKPFLIDSASAVSLFFVLSGFLITYLLLHEATLTGKVSIRKFYIRRVLRIWPLYYFIVTIGLLIFPLIFGSEYISSVFHPEYPSTTSITTRIALTFSFLPNFATISAPMAHIWSIGVEEQFYIIWPWAIYKKLSIVRICLGVLIIKFVLAPIIPLFHNEGMIIIFNQFRFECMAIGALGAYFYYKKLPWLKWSYHWGAQLLTLGTCVYMAGRVMPVNTYATTAISVTFLILILNVATNPHSLIKFNHPLLERLGQVSYGLYLYHFLILYVIISLLPRSMFLNETSFLSAVFLGTIGCTWLVAEASYRWFEKPILELKERYAATSSLDNALDTNK